MRTHAKFSYVALWRDEQQLREVVKLRSLAAARLEPIVRGLRGGALLDLVFCEEGRTAVLPAIEISAEMLMQRESSPFIWPESAGAVLREETAEEIERALLPWIESLTLARQCNAQTVRFFGDAQARELFGEARKARFVGATPYADVLCDIAPYQYAVRFAQNGRIAIHDTHGAAGSVLLRRHALEVRADLGDPQRNELALRWFGATHFGAIESPAAYSMWIGSSAEEQSGPRVRICLDVEIANGTAVEVATPVPTDVMVSFDPGDAPVCRRFSVQVDAPREPRPSLLGAAATASGGSSGRILLLMREDFARAPDADTDDALTLASHLRAEGFSVDLACASSAVVSAYDAVHAFTLARVDELAPALTLAHGAGIPVVLSPYLQDVSAQGAWGTGIVRALLRVARDEAELEDNFRLLEQRRLEGPGMSAQRQEPFLGYQGAVRAALECAGAVLICSDAEERLVRDFGYAGPLVRTGAAVALRPYETIDPIAGSGDFVLAHAPLEARSNLVLLVRAARTARLPLVILGPVIEPEYALALHEQADENVVFLAEPPPAAAQALYRAARVYADVPWISFGPHRVLAAAACGAAIVTAAGGYAASILEHEHVSQADPASERSLTAALQDAWAAARERPELLEAAARAAAVLTDPRAALVAAVQAYAAAQQPRAPA